MDECDAIAQLQRGDIGGLKVLVRRYQAPALRAAYLIGCDRALAEDIVQAAFLRAYERIGQFDASRPFGPWFLRSVVNDARKAAARQRHRPLDGPTLASATQQPSADTPPDDLLVAAETREAIRAALAQLTPGQRAVIVGRYYLDLSDTEVAARLDLPAGTVRRRLHDARRRLARALPAWLRQPIRGRAR